MDSAQGLFENVASAILADVEPWLPARRIGVTTDQTKVKAFRPAKLFSGRQAATFSQALITLVYNFKRVLNLVSFEQLMAAVS